MGVVVDYQCWGFVVVVQVVDWEQGEVFVGGSLVEIDVELFLDFVDY